MKFSMVVFAVLFAAPCATLGQPDAPSASEPSSPTAITASGRSAPGLDNRAPRYRLRKGDSFEVQFAFSPEFNQTIAVQPDGYITLKSVGTIPAEGITVPDLTNNIEQAYSGILNKPVVTLDLKDFDKPYFVVAGQVGKPGKFDLRSDLTLTEGVAIAGGFTEASKHSQVVLFRPAANGMAEARLIDVKKMLRSRDLTEDIHLRTGDMIFVPQNRISKIQKYIPTSSLGLYGNPQFY